MRYEIAKTDLWNTSTPLVQHTERILEHLKNCSSCLDRLIELLQELDRELNGSLEFGTHKFTKRALFLETRNAVVIFQKSSLSVETYTDTNIQRKASNDFDSYLYWYCCEVRFRVLCCVLKYFQRTASSRSLKRSATATKHF